jgi:hypothetical protein
LNKTNDKHAKSNTHLITANELKDDAFFSLSENDDGEPFVENDDDEYEEDTDIPIPDMA